ncbi:conserved hypothetical protein [Streptomyces scabiei 87.22]|uniref:MaoC-like domain-containing protein n=6 Tax=Streptomyces TaxID=1883 RepID=C9YZ47_STRSW|nr:MULTISPECIES: MaoC/PaaZ C-terminal domain-containing protein [Streptomyces]MBP5861907.1 hypothetical protein [Streptomyces sp. LBUM 1484]MBP5877637.1 hypothetical protein [Streptomyces sp. LBUM 1477]MBP5891699.1 hypothetical protein [Streptomyces sp. LBUM 1481]MBP5901446.1 hypothetical protein [Streptomyces sp. LBUM 1488]MBP5921857.1 hypothetical protein [Streptomyces sp. LBUM 1483]
MQPTHVLAAPPALGPALARGALRSPRKSRGLAGADSPDVPAGGFPRLVLPGVRIDLARLAAYERVCGFPTGEDALPLTYPHVLGFPLAMRIMSGRSFPLPLLGLVHTSIEITRRRRLPAHGEYEITVYVDGLTPHRRGTEATVVTEVRDGSEEEGGFGVGVGVSWESRSTYLARHGRRDGKAPGNVSGPAGEGGAGRVPGDPDRAEAVRGGGPEGEPVLPGVVEWRWGGDVGRRYGAVSGDRNPIHLHPLGARLFGFPRAIAHGMWTVARCLAEHGTPPATRVRAEFRAPVSLPGTVTYAADGQTWGGFELRGDAAAPGGQGVRPRVHVSGRVYPLVV